MSFSTKQSLSFMNKDLNNWNFILNRNYLDSCGFCYKKCYCKQASCLSESKHGSATKSDGSVQRERKVSCLQKCCQTDQQQSKATVFIYRHFPTAKRRQSNLNVLFITRSRINVIRRVSVCIPSVYLIKKW